MTKVRMSLAEAGDRLGLAPNSIRSRWKAGKIEGSRDNAGKIWVHLDPKEVVEIEGASNPSNPSNPSFEPASKGSTEPGSNPAIEGVEGFEAGRAEAQAAHIETLTGQLGRATAELDALRPRMLEGARALAQAEALTAALAALRSEREAERWSHRGHVEDLRRRAERAEQGEEEARTRLAALREEAERARRRGFWGRLLRREGPAPA